MRPVTLGLLTLFASSPLMSQQWPIHSMERPRPPVVDPGPERPPVPPPADAVVLFDGTDLSQWVTDDSVGGPAQWIVKDGYMEVAPGTGDHRTRRVFGNVQLHIEWATPARVEGHSQERGNSGVYLMGLYEIQVLDSYGNDTYPDGQAAALYGQVPPLVNASRPPGRWQTYDIVFRRPRFAADGSVAQAARVTVFHNGVLVQDNVAFTGRTVHARAARYEPHGDRLPIKLQDHGNPMRFRNIWVRELPESP
jgi:3-keto-disaccharide hydrolase